MTINGVHPFLGLMRAAKGQPGLRPLERATVFKCPYPNCGVPAQHFWAVVTSAQVPSSKVEARELNGTLICAQCSNCSNEVIFWKGEMVWPRVSLKPSPSEDMPEDLMADYNEAGAIYQTSPRGAAALLRLVIQKLCCHLETKSSDINGAIKELVAEGRITTSIQQSLDILRVMGNEAVHPGVLDIRDDVEAVNSLFTIVNFIVEKTITEPKLINSIYNSLPQSKLDGIEARDKKPSAS